MKKKFTFSTFAVNNLKARKKNYALMITGIILAMIFSSSILFFASSMISSMKEMSKNAYGDCKIIMFNSDENIMRDAYEDKVVTEYGFAHIIGYLEGTGDEQLSGVSVGYLDKSAEKLSYISFLEGEYPQREGEIALEKAALAKLSPFSKLGDTITLRFYNRNGEEIAEEYTEKSYKLVGIARNKLSNITQYSASDEYAKCIPSAFVYLGAQPELGGRESLCCYLNYNTEIKNETDSSGYGTFRDYMEEKHISRENYETIFAGNEMLFNYGYAFSFALAVILVCVLLIASCIGIVNAFSSNLNERKKQIGMLRTVGATKRQIIIIFGREAFFISLFCAPVSVVLSYFLVKTVTGFMGEDFIFVPQIWVLALSILFGVCCVMLAALIPLVSASRISPLSSIRNIEMMRKMKTKRIKTKKSFNMPELLAKRNLVFFRSKQVIVSIILVITIVFSCYGFSFYDCIKDERYHFGYDYHLNISRQMIYNEFTNIKNNTNGFSENQKRDILLTPYVENVNGSKSCKVIVRTDELSDYIKTNYYVNVGFSAIFKDSSSDAKEKITKDNVDKYFGEFSSDYYEVKNRYSFSENIYNCDLVSVEEDVLKKLDSCVISGKINIDKIASGEEIIIYAPQKVAFSIETDESGDVSSYRISRNEDIKNEEDYLKIAQCDYKAGNTLDLSILTGDKISGENSFPDNCDRKDKAVTIGAVVDNVPREFSNEYNCGGNILFFTTNEGMKTFLQDAKYNLFNITLNTECTQEIDDRMNAVLSSIHDAVSGSYLYSKFGTEQEESQIYNTILIAVISIIILFLCISASIINNSLAARIRESKREMGTLRAVGATQRDLVVSYIRQLLSMFGWGYVIGFGGFCISYLIAVLAYRFKYGSMFDFQLNFNIWQTLIACAVLFAVCSINLWVKIRKEMKNSIIDNIREL